MNHPQPPLFPSPALGSGAIFISVSPQLVKPISNDIARLIQNRAKGIDTLDVLGSSTDINILGQESLLPAMVKTSVLLGQPRIRIGSNQCSQPYDASLLNCSALSYGPMGKNFILALNQAALKGGFYQNTGEAGLTPYHLGVDVDVESDAFNTDIFFQQLAQQNFEEAGDIVWQLGNGYFGCRQADGSFDSTQFQLKASLVPIKMIEIKLSQGIEPWAKMPVKEVTMGMMNLMGIAQGKQAVLQDQHAAFSSPVQLLYFVKQLRGLSGGKPIGIKMGISHRHYFLALCKAIRKTGILIDFISIDGMEAGTAAAQSGTLGYTGTALNDALVFVQNALTGTRLRDQIKVIASGRVFTEQDIIAKLVRGADLCATARGMMLAVGCDQQLKCNQGNCMQGIATQDPLALRNFNIPMNVERLVSYHQLTIQGLKGLLSIAGLTHPAQLKPFHIQKRVSYSELLLLDEVYEFLKAGALLSPWFWNFPKRYKHAWRMADPEAPFVAP